MKVVSSSVYAFHPSIWREEGVSILSFFPTFYLSCSFLAHLYFLQDSVEFPTELSLEKVSNILHKENWSEISRLIHSFPLKK